MEFIVVFLRCLRKEQNKRKLWLFFSVEFLCLLVKKVTEEGQESNCEVYNSRRQSSLERGFSRSKSIE